MDELKAKTEFSAIDIMKFICSLMIVAIHIPIFPSSGTFNTYVQFFITQYVSRIATPFFFVCSGFFLFRKMPQKEIDYKIVLKYIKRILALYAIWTALYIPVNYLDGRFNSSKGFLYGLIKYVYSSVVYESYFHLWYFPALVIGILIVASAIRRKLSIKALLAVGGVLYAVGLLFQSYYGIIEPLSRAVPFLAKFHATFAESIVPILYAIFEGILFISMGAYFAYEQHVMGARKSFSLFALSMALLLIEVFMLTKLDVSHGSPMYFFLPPATFFLFSTVVRMKIGGSKKSYKIMRSLSTFIYVVHMLVNRVIGIAFDKIGFWAGKVPLLMYSLTIIASVGIGLLVIELSKRKTFKCLKYLY